MVHELKVPDRILMGPGPSDVSSMVLRAMSTPLLGHLDPEFLEIMNRTMELLRYVFETENALTVPMSGTGSAGMETAFVNFLEPGDRVLIGVKGLFGQRMADVAGRLGADVHTVEEEWGRPIDPARFEEAIRRVKPKVVAVVHAETSTGVRQPLEDIAALAHDHGALFLVDCVTSLGGISVGVDRVDIDIAYSGSQKCLSCPPGLAPVTVSERAREVLRGRGRKVQSWYLDLTMIQEYWGAERFYHHTAPINMIYALHEALRIIREEGLVERFSRHLRLGRALQAGLEAMGLELLVEEPYRLPMLTAVKVPEGTADAEVRGTLLARYGIEIGGGLGALKGRIWRVGLMGQSCSPKNVVLFLTALEDVLRERGMDLPPGAGVARAVEVMEEGAH